MRHLTKSIVSLFLGVGFMGACSAPVLQSAPTQPQPTAVIANPASKNCIQQGGTHFIQKRGDGGEYGVCVFEDNKQCEEWAMLRGECPTGGISITHYITPAAQYCAITGGEYKVTGSRNTFQEQGTCTFKNGKTCDAWDYFAGKCDRHANPKQSLYNGPFAYCAAVGTVDAPDERYKGPEMPDSVVQGLIREGVVLNVSSSPMLFSTFAIPWHNEAGSRRK